MSSLARLFYIRILMKIIMHSWKNPFRYVFFFFYDIITFATSVTNIYDIFRFVIVILSIKKINKSITKQLKTMKEFLVAWTQISQNKFVAQVDISGVSIFYLILQHFQVVLLTRILDMEDEFDKLKFHSLQRITKPQLQVRKRFLYM